jgi:hypothetical protein
MRTLSALVPPLALLTGCEILLQVHAWRFWHATYGPSGPAVAVVLAVLAATWWARAAWSGWRGLGLAGLALVATLVCLAGPMLSVATPVLEEVRAAEEAAQIRASRLESIRADMTLHREELDRLLGLAEQRPGWKESIDAAHTRLETLQDQRAAILASPAPVASVQWRAHSSMLLLLVALVLMQTGVATSAAWAGARLRRVRQAETATETAAETAETPFRVRRLRNALLQRIERSGLSRNIWGKQHGVSPKDISLLVNHQDNAAQGKPTISERKLADLEARFLAQAARA